jgi:hypothetical protein
MIPQIDHLVAAGVKQPLAEKWLPHIELAMTRFAINTPRQVAAWLGLVPRQHSSGGKTVLLGITKRGDSYLRTLLVHGARSAILAAQRRQEGAPSWMSRLLERKHPNVACVALANRNARIVWALLTHKRDYEPQYGMKGTDENLSLAQAL